MNEGCTILVYKLLLAYINYMCHFNYIKYMQW